MANPSFIKNKEGLYRVRGHVKPEEIVDTAAAILLDDLITGGELTNAASTAQFLQLSLAKEVNELFCVLFLDKRHRVLAFEKLFQGTIDSAVVHPRVVVQRAIALNAAAVILAHNHPSNDCEPSQADRMITEQLSKTLALIDVTVLDHFVVSSSGHVSLAERGWI